MQKEFFSKRNRITCGFVAVSSLIFLGGGVAHASTQIPVESFSGNVSVSENWIAGGAPVSACLTAGGNVDATPIPGCGRPKIDELGSGVLRLTRSDFDQTGFLLYNSPLPSADGLDAIFYASQWGGDGADGIAFFFTDGAHELTAPGGNGGSLGYAVKYAGTADEQKGVSHALLGIGFDVYGAFGTADANGGNCEEHDVFRANSIGIRGPGNNATGYCWIAGVGLDSKGIQLHGGTREEGAHLLRVRVDGSDVADRKVTVFVDGEKVLSAPLPQEFIDAQTVKFGWTAGTGGSMDNHEIWGATISPAAQPDDFEYEVPTLEDDRINSVTEELPPTGSKSGAALLISVALLLAGAALVAKQNRHRTA